MRATLSAVATLVLLCSWAQPAYVQETCGLETRDVAIVAACDLAAARLAAPALGQGRPQLAAPGPATATARMAPSGSAASAISICS